MCRHCDKLTEDKQIVHDFMAVAARRLSELHLRNIYPDWIDIKLEVTIPGQSVLSLLDEMTKEHRTAF